MFGEMMRPRHDLAGLRVPIRGLGFTPMGAQLPSECSQYGTRMIEEQGGYTPIGCPIGPDCHDIIDATTGQIVVAKAKGAMPWLDLCTQFGYQKDGQAPPVAAPESGSGSCIEPDPQGSGGCRDVVPCPKGPAVSNNPDGAAGPGQGRRYTLVDYKTGELIKDDVGDEIWNQYSVSSLPDAWVCEDPRCKPYCGQDAAAPEPDVQEAAPEPEPESTPSPEPSAPTTPAPIPTTPVTQLSPPQAGFQTPCNPGRPTQMGRARMSRDFFGRSMF